MIRPLSTYICTLLILIIINSRANAQFYESDDKRAEIIEATLWSTAGPEFADTVVPEKWKDESQVVLCRQIDYRVDREVGLLFETYYYHERVKLLNEAAVSDFSEFSFHDNYKFPGLFTRNEIKNYAGFKVVKPDGSEQIIDMDAAVKMNLEKGRDNYQYNKIAIPNLEPGDIVDYYTATEFKFKAPPFYAFNPIYYTFIEESPIKKQIINLRFFDKCYLNAKSINGAPDLKLVEENKNFRSYTIVDTNRAGLENSSFMSFSRDMPILKIQPYYSFTLAKPTTTYNVESLLVGSRKDLKSEIDYTDLGMLNPLFTNYTPPFLAGFTGVQDPYSRFIKATLKYLRKNYSKKEADKNLVARDAYYFLREYYYRNKYTKTHLKSSSYYSVFYPMSQMGLVHTLAVVYHKWDIDFELLYTTPNTISSLDDWLFIQEISPYIRVTEDDTLYITDLKTNSLLGDIPDYLQGNKAYCVSTNSINYPPSGSKTPVSKTNIPVHTPELNQINVTIRAEIEDFESPLKANYRYQVSGYERYRWDSVLVTSEDYYANYDSKYLPYINEPQLYTEGLKSLHEAQRLTKIEEIKRRDDFLKELVKSKTGQEDVSIENFILHNPGRWEDAAQLVFSFDVQLQDMLVDMGMGYLIPTGILLGNDSRVTQLDDSIGFNFITPGPYHFTQILELHLPEGYTVSQVEGIKDILQNDAGKFLVESCTEGNKICIKTEEYLYANYYQNSVWSDYKALMNKVFDLTGQQVVIEPESAIAEEVEPMQ